MRLRSAETLRALMHQQNLSLGGLAAAAQCSKSFVSHLLSGRRNTCTSALADRIAEALDVPTRVLFAPSKSITDRQSGHASLPPAAPDLPSALGSGLPQGRPGPRSARPRVTGRKARRAPRCGWVPQRVLSGDRGKAVEWLSGSLHRRLPGALVGHCAHATSPLPEVTPSCSSEAATR
ncbi:helix-turn-helix domain-containing protein [Jatrophihabitans sp.]|uniref:helix-turn-helix domain-containing protein n=1 Tax=Jatrophihabitans sp. TaxID=1932789 RepID=UPI0038CD249D